MAVLVLPRALRLHLLGLLHAARLLLGLGVLLLKRQHALLVGDALFLDLPKIKHESGDDEHVGQDERDHAHRRRQRLLADEAQGRAADGRDEQDPPDEAQTLVARRVGLVILALHLALLGGSGLAGGLLLGLALLGRLLRRLHGDRGGGLGLRLGRGGRLAGHAGAVFGGVPLVHRVALGHVAVVLLQVVIRVVAVTDPKLTRLLQVASGKMPWSILPSR